MTLFSKLRTFFADDTIPTGLRKVDLHRSILQEAPLQSEPALMHLEEKLRLELQELADIEDGLIALQQLEALEEGLD